MRILAFAAAATVLAGSGFSAIISNNLNPANSLGAAQSAGVVPAINWNNLNTGADLKDDTGATTTLDLTSSAGNNYVTALTVVTADDRMMSTFRGVISAGSWQSGFVIDQVPYPVYDLIVYWGGVPTDRTGNWAVGYRVVDPVSSELLAGTETYYMRYNVSTANSAASYWDGAYTQATATTAAAALTGTEYVRWDGLTASTFRVQFNSSAQRAGVSGFQIIEVPEPAGLLLLGLAGICLLRRR